MMQLDDALDPLLGVDDDDNAAIDSDTSDVGIDDVDESPLLLALDDLESRVVSALNDFKAHPGRATDPSASNVHDELASVLRPVVEASSHAGPSAARMLASTYPRLLGLEGCVDEIYTRVNSSLVLPVVLESAQSDAVPAKRAASLALFHTLYVEWQKGGSYLDATVAAGPSSSLAGPYGPGGGAASSSSSAAAAAAAAPPPGAAEASRRNQIRAARRSELLRRWVQAAIPNLAPGAYTSATSDAAVASRGVLSASASIKPCLRYMAERIGNADDAGALRLFLPVMRMISGVLGRLFLERARGGAGGGRTNEGGAGDSLRASCIKFLEIVVLCFSNRALPGAAEGSAAALRMQKKDAPRNSGGASGGADFSLEDLPPGHPVITREGLEEIGEYCFSTLRGLVLLGGQAAIDPGLLLAAVNSSSGGSDFMGGE
jgi:symplekin